MKDVILNTATCQSVIHCGEGAFEAYSPKLLGRQLFLISDTTVYKLYGDLVARTFGEIPKFIIKAGEKSKNYDNLLKILRTMLASGMRRNCLVIALGGGVVGDIAGLAASLYMRGVDLVQIPTTLLSQVDSSVGGKTAIDLDGVKNAVGAFYQPSEVIVDPMFLDTLKPREIRCGLGEIVKYGALNAKIYDLLLKNKGRLKSEKFLSEVVIACIEHKRDVVEMDERDSGGVRASLNLGHTTAHAFELHFGGLSHGEWVSIGSYFELYIAEKEGLCGGKYAENLKKLIKSAVKIPVLKDVESAAVNAMHDKKNVDAMIKLVAPKCEGEWVEIELPLEKYAKYLKECAENEAP